MRHHSRRTVRGRQLGLDRVGSCGNPTPMGVPDLLLRAHGSSHVWKGN